MNQNFNTECTPEEIRLVESLVNNSEQAFEVLYKKHAIVVYRMALNYLKSTELAEEVVQDVFMKLWQKRDTIRTTLPIEAWLYTVGKNNVLNRLKKIANEYNAINQLKIIHPSEDNSMQDKLKENDYQNTLKSVLKSLSENQLKVFMMARHENLSYVEIGRFMDISPLTVKTHMARALGHIKMAFNPQQLYS